MATSPLNTTLTSPDARAFLLHLASERGLAINSIHAYRRDLENLDRHLKNRGSSLTSATADDLRKYLQDQTRRGRSTRTVARRIAAIRLFVKFIAQQEKHAQRA